MASLWSLVPPDALGGELSSLQTNLVALTATTSMACSPGALACDVFFSARPFLVAAVKPHPCGFGSW